MQVIERTGEFSARFAKWKANDDLSGYPFVENRNAPFTPLRRALPLLNLGLISSAGAYITGTEGFDLGSRDGDTGFCEIPVEVDARDLSFAAKGYDPSAVKSDRNSLIPIDRLLEFQANAVIGKLNDVWWSVSSYIPNAALAASELAQALTARIQRYNVQAVLLIPASRLCHQTLGIVARAIELSGVPTMMLSVDAVATDRVRPPRTAHYTGEFGSVAGKPNWPEYQRRVLEEAVRWIETFDQPASRKLSVDLETQVEAARGER